MNIDLPESSEFSGFFKKFLEREYGAYIWRPRNANRNGESIASNEPNSETSANACLPLPVPHKEF